MYDLSDLQGKGDAKTVKPARMAETGVLAGQDRERTTVSGSDNAHLPRGDPDITRWRDVAHFMTQWGEIGEQRTHFALVLHYLARVLYYCFFLVMAWMLKDAPGQLVDVVTVIFALL